MTDTPDPRERVAHHLAEMEAWLDGRRSHANRINGYPCTPDVAAVAEAALVQADAQQATAHAVAAQAWAATIALSGEHFYIDLRAVGVAR